MSEIDNDYVTYSQQDLVNETEDKKLISSLKNGWNIFISVLIIGGFVLSSYEDFQDNELFFQSGLSCLESKNLIIEIDNAGVEKYEVVRGYWQTSIEEYRIFQEYRTSDAYLKLSSYEQIELHNKIIPNLKNETFKQNLFSSIEDYETFANVNIINLDLNGLHPKSHQYATKLSKSLEANKNYINEIKNGYQEKLILVELLEDFYFDWEVAITTEDKNKANQDYNSKIGVQIDFLDGQIEQLNNLNSIMNQSRDASDTAYFEMNLDKCNNED